MLEDSAIGELEALDLSSPSPSLAGSIATLFGGELLLELACEGAKIGAVGYELTGVEGIEDIDIIIVLVVGWPGGGEAKRKSVRHRRRRLEDIRLVAEQRSRLHASADASPLRPLRFLRR